MIHETISSRGTTVVKRLILEPGEATAWHYDPFHRVTVIVRGDALAIEYHDGAASQHISVAAGQVDWDVPTERRHRAVNVGATTYEEVAIFFLDRPDAIAQPTVTKGTTMPPSRRASQPITKAPTKGEC
jgi:quercetin dioxygenase-like cupin family protein